MAVRPTDPDGERRLRARIAYSVRRGEDTQAIARSLHVSTQLVTAVRRRMGRCGRPPATALDDYEDAVTGLRLAQANDGHLRALAASGRRF